MPAGVDVVDGIVQAIGVRIDAADRLGFEIADKIFVQESARLGVVIAAVQVVKPDGRIIVVPAVTEGVILHDPAFRLLQQIALNATALGYIIRLVLSIVNPQKTRGAWIAPCSFCRVFRIHLTIFLYSKKEILKSIDSCTVKTIL